MNKINITLIALLLLLTVTTKAQEYIDVTVRLDDYWAEVLEVGGGEPTWHTYFTIGGNTSSTKHVYHADPGGAYITGAWFNQSLYYYPVTKVLDTNDNLVIYLEGWEEDKTLFGSVWDYLNFDDNDDSLSTGSKSDTNISTNTRGEYVAACGGEVLVGASSRYYKVETAVMWNWSLPVNPSFSLTNVGDEDFTIDFGSTNSYRVTDWTYQVSELSDFSTIVATGTVSEDEQITGLDQSTTYYVKILGTNERGSGSYTSAQNITTTYSWSPVSNPGSNALHFDGIDDYVISSNYVDLSFKSFAIEGWFKADVIPSAGTYPHIFGIPEIGSDAAFVRINGDSKKLEFVMNSSAGFKVVSSLETIQTDIWYHAAILYHMIDGVDAQYLLINGEVVASQSFTHLNNYSNQSFCIGGDGTHNFDGQVDDVKVWSNFHQSSQGVRDYMYKEVVGNETNLLAYYKLDEASGTLTDNATGNPSYDATLTNMIGNEWTTSSAFFGPKNCLDFDGLDGNVWCPNISPTVISGSIEFWVNLDVIPADNARLISRHSSYGYDEIYLLSNDGRIATAGSFVVGDDLLSTNPLPTDVWTHVAITADGSGSKLYINGILDDTGGAADFYYNTFRFGGQFTAGFWEGIDGMMDEVRLWNVVRTESEIRENMFKSLAGDESGLVAYFNLDNAYGAVAQSYPAEANDGSIGGGATWVTSTAFNTWLNTDNSDWGTAANWSTGSVPISTDNVGIPNNEDASLPSIPSVLTIKSLSIETGVSLNLASSTITAAKNIFNNGILTVTGEFNYAASTLYNNGTFANNGTTSLYDFTNNSGATATIASGKQLTVTNNFLNSGTFTNEGATTLTNLTNTGAFNVNSTATTNGSLIVSGSSTGNITYNRYLLGNKWHLFSAPIGAQSINSFVTNAANNVPRSSGGTGPMYALSPYDNTGIIGATTWDYYTIGGSNEATTAGNFTAGKGYQVYTTAAGTIAFTGTVPTTQTNLAVTVDASNTWNLVGNPYPSSIPANFDADGENNFLIVNASELDPSNTAIYIWDAATSAYVLVNHDSEATYIAPGQSFFVKSSAANTLNFTTAMRMHQPTAVFQKGNGNLKPTIQLIAENAEGKISTTKIKYVAGTSYGLDPGYDASTFSAVESSYFGVYSKLIEDNGVNFSLQIVPDENYEKTVIPIVITTDASAEVTFKAVYENLPFDKKVFLEDRLLSIFTEINESSKNYTVSLTNENNIEGRFYIHTLAMKPTESSTELTDLRIVSYYDTNSLKVIGNLEEISTIEIFDTLGRFIFKSTVSNEANEISVPSMAKGIYYVKINSPTKKSSTKIAWY